MIAALERVESALADHGCNPKRRGHRLDARCPAHDDRSPSLTVSVGKVQPVVFHCHAQCEAEDVLAALDLSWADVCEERRPIERPTVVARYPYTDENGTVVLTVERVEPGYDGKRKSFVRVPKGAPSPLYRLPAVLEAVLDGQPVYVAEGEKDVDALVAAGVCGTCNPGGAGKFLAAHADALAEAEVVIVADKDKAGADHAVKVADMLDNKAASLRVVEAAKGKDAADHLAAGYTVAELVPVTIDELRDRHTEGEHTEPGLDDDEPLPYRTGPRGGVIAASLGAYVGERLGLELGEDGRLWRYHRGVFIPDGDQAARALARHTLGDKFSRAAVDECFAWLRSGTPTITGLPDVRYVNTATGMLDWSTGRLEDHDPKYRSTWQVPVEWSDTHTDGQGEAVLGFLETVFPADAIPFALELVGYCLYPGNPFRKAVLLLGAGRNGKTTFLELIRALIGPKACASIPLQTLAENRFAVAELYGRAANIAGDLDARSIKRTDTFKTVTGGDEVHAERKYAPPFSFRPWATLLFSANEAPLSADQSDGWFDRWLVVPFTNRIPDDELDPHLLEKLTAPAELAALLYLAVDGLRALMSRGGFDPPPSITEAHGAYRERLDTVAAFVAERCSFHIDCWLPRTDLYRNYREWITDGGRHPLSSVTFNEHLTRHAAGAGHPLTTKTRRGVRGFAGIGWTS